MPAKLYNELLEQLQGRNHDSRKLENNTYLRRGSLVASPDVCLINIRLHNTNIVTVYPSGSVVLNTGGWNTVTTRDRLNGFLSDHVGSIGNGRPYRLYQNRGILTLAQASNGGSVWDASAKVATMDRKLTIGPRGGITTDASPTLASDQDKLKKRIRAFAKLCTANLPLPMPDNGDCMFCHLFARPDGPGNLPSAGGSEHFLSHMDEGYVVPSLVWNALVYNGCTPNAGGSYWFSVAFGEYRRGDDSNRVAQFVYRFVARSLGLAV